MMRRWDIAVIAFCFVCAFALWGVICTSGCTTWRSTTAKSLNAAKQGTDAVAKVSATVLHSRCLAVAAGCKVPALKCAPLVKCQQSRAAFNAVVLKVYASLDLARVAYHAALTAAGKAEWQAKAVKLVVLALAEYDALMRAAKTLGVVP